MKLAPSSPFRFRTVRDTAGLTLLELLVVIAIIGILSALSISGIERAKSLADSMKNTASIREIGLATIQWAGDNGFKLPSPQYPGGMAAPPGVSDEDFFPENYDLSESGLWLDGVVFAQMYMREDKAGNVTGYDVNENGDHLRGTHFVNLFSVKNVPDEENYHKHSYAMNANLRYDRIYDQVQSSDPWLTEKSMANLIQSPHAMLFIDCQETNVVMAEDIGLIEETMETRYKGRGKLVICYLDGHAERIRFEDIPNGDIESEREASRFWRGVDP